MTELVEEEESSGRMTVAQLQQTVPEVRFCGVQKYLGRSSHIPRRVLIILKSYCCKYWIHFL